MKTSAIFVLALAAVPASAHPITGSESKQRGNDGEQQPVVRHHNWGRVGTTVGKAAWGVAKVALLRREPEALFSDPNFVNHLDTRDFDEDLEARDFDELELRYFDDELEARDFDKGLEARDFDDECVCPEARDFPEPRDYHEALERRGHHCPVCRKTAKSDCVGKHFEYRDVYTDKTHMMGEEYVSCKNTREAEERSQQHDGTTGGQGAIPYITPRHEPEHMCADCSSKQIKSGEPIRCKECGHRVMIVTTADKKGKKKRSF